MSRPVKIPPEIREAMVETLKAHMQRKQEELGGRSNFTQTDLGAEIGRMIDPHKINAWGQNIVSQWFDSKRTIPDLTWCALGDFFGFNLFENREDLELMWGLMRKAKLKHDMLREDEKTTALLELFNKADAKGKETILRVAESEAVRGSQD